MNLKSGLRRSLMCLTPLYQLGLTLRERRLASGSEPIRRLRFPVVSIGNLSTGGAGKTPLAIALAEALTRRGFAVDVLSRGYGRRGKTVARVNPNGTADEFGDEPLLIAQQAKVPVFVAAQRYDAGLLAESDFPHPAPDESAPQKGVHILDDGFQHRQLHRDIDIVLMNRSDWRDRLLPAGNLREGLRAAKRASVVSIPANDPELEAELRTWGWDGPLWKLRRRMETAEVGGAVFAFCGIARPEQFFAGLEAAGVRVAGRRAFADHHRYTARDLDRLAEQGRAAGASFLLTTEKDRVRLGRRESALPVITAGFCTEIDEEPAAVDWLVDRLGTIRED